MTQQFNHDQFIAGREDSASNFAYAQTCGANEYGMSLDRIRKMAEECDSLQGFLIYNAIGGGTGSGISAQLCEALSVQFGK